jgi:hypothetical protein
MTKRRARVVSVCTQAKRAIGREAIGRPGPQIVRRAPLASLPRK